MVFLKTLYAFCKILSHLSTAYYFISEKKIKPPLCGQHSLKKWRKQQSIINYDVMLNNKEMRFLKFGESVAVFHLSTKRFLPLRDANQKNIFHCDVWRRHKTLYNTH